MQFFEDLPEGVLLAMKEFLLGLHDGSIKPKNSYQGICVQMAIQFRTSLTDYQIQEWVVEAASDGYEFYSGHPSYPILHPKIGVSPEVGYDISDLWSGEYGKRRKSLCLKMAMMIPS